MKNFSEDQIITTVPRGESDFLQQNKKKVRSQPWQVKSEFQGYGLFAFGPEYQHYKLLMDEFRLVTNWIEINLGIEYSRADKNAILAKIHIVPAAEYEKFAAKKDDYKNVAAFVRGNSREMLLPDVVEGESLTSFVFTFRHEIVHMLSRINFVVKTDSTGRRRHYREMVKDFGLEKFRLDGPNFFVAFNEATTETLNYESYADRFKDPFLYEGPVYGTAMILFDCVLRDMIRRAPTNSGESQKVMEAAAINLRHMCYKDMLTGSRDFFHLFRAVYGGRAVRKLAQVDTKNLKKITKQAKDLVEIIGPELAADFAKKSQEYLANKPVMLLGGLELWKSTNSEAESKG